MRPPGPLLSGGRLIHPPDTSMDVLAAWGGIRPYRDLPFPGLVGKPVADLELHRQDAAWLPRRRIRLLLGPLWLLASSARENTAPAMPDPTQQSPIVVRRLMATPPAPC